MLSFPIIPIATLFAKVAILVYTERINRRYVLTEIDTVSGEVTLSKWFCLSSIKGLF